MDITKYALTEVINEYKTEILEKNNIQYYKDDILRIVSFVLKQNKNEIFIHLNDITITLDVKDKINEYLNKYYLENIPLQYILGYQAFYNEEYIVNEYVLIPREDTEILVRKAIEYISKYNFKVMLDLCCGSGCIGISTLQNSTLETCVFGDVSKKALKVVNQNIIHNKVNKKVLTIESDLFSNIKDKFDIIVSNPPYVRTSIIPKLDKYVQNEPILALDGGKDGMDMYRKIMSKVSNHLNNNGILMFEIGYDQLDEITNLISNFEEFEILEKVKDYSNNDRVVICRFHHK